MMMIVPTLMIIVSHFNIFVCNAMNSINLLANSTGIVVSSIHTLLPSLSSSVEHLFLYSTLSLYVMSTNRSGKIVFAFV